VVCLTWDDAKAHVDWLARKTGKPYRLLSEAEWEYAARGETVAATYPTRFWFGDNERDMCRYGNGGTKDLCNDGYEHTSPVVHYHPNTFGLYDMFGNAWQWTADSWHSNYNGAPADGAAWTAGCQGNGHVLRGGSWLDVASSLRAAMRYSYISGNSTSGLRVARTLAR
jgi:formylglycine-generating enzyme required for sulfatase activity